MKKAILSLVLAAGTCVATWATVHAPNIGGIYYNLDDETHQGTVMGCNVNGSITLPATVNYQNETYQITDIAPYAFLDKRGVTQVTIQQGSLTTIGNQAFSNSGIVAITLPESLTTIGSSVFYGADKLNSIVIPDGVTAIGDRAFTGCNSLEQIKLPAGITTISEFMFSGCNSLKSLDIPEGVTTINAYAITNCAGLTSVNLPSTLQRLEQASISGNPGITAITLPQSLRFIGENTLAFLGISSITIPEGVTTIEDYAFAQNNHLRSASIPGTVTSLGSLFTDCPGLARVYYRGTTISAPGVEAFAPELWESSMHLIVSKGMKNKIDEDMLWYYFPIITEEVSGDVDANGTADVSDVNDDINTLLGKGDAVNAAGADVNHDGIIDISDVSQLINIILNK